jgi:hypothetical protein
MMLTIQGNGSEDCSEVIVLMDSGIGISKRCIELKWNAGSALFARLLIDQLNKQLHDSIRRIREEEYNRGYKDGRGHQERDNYFRPTFS